MNRLRKGMYPKHALSNGLFGLRDDQERTVSVVGYAGWYNLDGELLGCGDLSMRDFANIMTGLIKHEAFIVLPVERGKRGEGIDHVVENAWFVIIPHVIYKIPVKTPRLDGEVYIHPLLGRTIVMSRERLLDELTSPVPVL